MSYTFREDLTATTDLCVMCRRPFDEHLGPDAFCPSGIPLGVATAAEGGLVLSGETVERIADAVVKKLEQRKAKVGEDDWHYPGQSASFHTEIG